MQPFLDLLPLVVFFAVYMIDGIYSATAALMAAMVLLIGYQWLRHRTVSKMLLISGALALVFGTITLVLRNPLFIQWKVTVVEWLFAAICLGSQFVGQKTVIERLMGHAVELESRLWRQLNMTWVIVFFLIGALNLYVMYNFSEETWAYFKAFGVLAITALTLVGQAWWIVRAQPNVVEKASVPESDANKRG